MQITAELLATLPYNTVSGSQYNGANQDELMGAQMENKYTSSEWGTFIQWRNKGYKIKKGEHGCRVRRFGEVTITDKDKNETKTVPFTTSVVFNRDQVEKMEK